jgi:hypothetical protein
MDRMDRRDEGGRGRERERRCESKNQQAGEGPLTTSP